MPTDNQNENTSSPRITAFDREKIIRVCLENLKTMIDEAMAKLNTPIAKLRTEVYELSQEVKEKNATITKMEAYLRLDLKHKLKDAQAAALKARRERRASNFLSGDNGLLFSFADMLSSLNAMPEPAQEADITKFMGRHIWPIANRLIVYSKPLDEVAAPDVDGMDLDQLLALAMEMPGDADTPNLDLMDELLPLLAEVTSDGFESRIEGMPAAEACGVLRDRARSMADVLRRHGILVADDPDEATMRYFRTPASGELPSPLVMRSADALVFSPGVSAKADDSVSLY